MERTIEFNICYDHIFNSSKNILKVEKDFHEGEMVIKFKRMSKYIKDMIEYLDDEHIEYSIEKGTYNFFSDQTVDCKELIINFNIINTPFIITI
jgi:hypothetical protein